jgi:iron complex outermembrane receptor protein
LTAGVQYAETRQTDENFANLQGVRGPQTKDQINRARLVGFYVEDQFNLTPAVTLVVGGRLQYAFRSVDDHFQTEFDARPDDSGNVDYLAFSPKVGAIWAVNPTAQIYGNISNAYEPPLILELTAPGQLSGDLNELKPQNAWQFEVGSRGSWGRRLTWDVSAYDIELWDEIQNVNVQPFPGAPFTIPRFQNIARSRHTGVEAGADSLLLDGVAQTLGMGDVADTLTLRTAYTWSRFVFVDDPTFNNNDIPGAPEHFIVGEVRYDHPVRFWIAPRVESVPKGYFVNSENTVRTDPYVLLSLRMGYEHVPWRLRLFFEARNLTDTNFVSAVVVDSADGRFFQPGDGRGFYGGMEVKF